MQSIRKTPWTVEKIRKALGNKLIGNVVVRESVCKTLLLLPNEILKHVTKDVWFISSPEDAFALTFKGEELKNRHLIFLSDELFQESQKQITYTILHEVGHVVLNHRNSIGYQQTQLEIKKQEIEADTFAKNFI